VAQVGSVIAAADRAGSGTPAHPHPLSSAEPSRPRCFMTLLTAWTIMKKSGTC